MTQTTPTRDEAVLSAAEIERIIDAYVRVRVDFPSDLTTVTILGKGTAASSIANRLASASAPASGRVDAALPGPNKQLDRVLIGEGEYVRADEAIKTIMELQRQLYDADKRLASLSPAATPVSEDGTELHGPFGYLVIDPELDEEHWRLSSEPDRDPELRSLAMFTKVDPFNYLPPALAKPASSPADAVIWQTRMRPIWDLASPWSPWTGSTKAHAEACAAKPISGDWEIEARALVPASLSPSEAEPVAWQSMETAPRDGTWFEARTESGYRRRVHFARDDDRLPIDHSNEMWSTVPVEWRPLAVPDAVKTLETRIAKLMAELQNSATAEGQWHNRAQSAETALKAIAEHPEQSDDGARSYKVWWAFWNVQNIAKAALSQSTSAGRVGG